MELLTPLSALIAGLLTVPLLLLMYFLKLRRKPMPVSSTLLWKQAVQDLQVNAPFQKLRRNLLLLLQLLILAALLMAMARPAWQGEALAGRKVVFVIDHSASMNATDVAPTRLAHAKERALKLIDQLDSGGSGMVVSVAGQARVHEPFTSDLYRLRQAVRSIEPTDEVASLEQVAKLIEPFASGAEQTGEAVDVLLLSDGRVEDRESIALPGAVIRYQPIGPDPGGEIGDSASNLGFVAMSARRDYFEPTKVQVFAELANASPGEVQANVDLIVDEAVQQTEPVTVPAAEVEGELGRRSLQFDLELTGAAVIEVRHDFDDALVADNRAAAVLGEPQDLNVLLVSDGNRFLSKAIEAGPVRRMATLSPDVYANTDPDVIARGGGDSYADGFDVIVFDRYSPQRLPPVNALYFSAAPPLEGVSWVEWTEDGGGPRLQSVLNWQRDHPVLQHAQLDDVEMAEPGRLVVPTLAEVLATGRSGPVMASVSGAERRDLVVGFNVLQSNWPVLVGFPVFVNNALQHLGPGGQSGQAVSVRAGQTGSVPVTDPNLSDVVFAGPERITAEVRGRRAVLPPMPQVGMYRPQGAAAGSVSPVAVNLASELESDVRPVAQYTAEGGVVADAASTTTVRQELWRYLAWVALAVLLVEWVLYTRKLHL